jgi:hypothetical protein
MTKKEKTITITIDARLATAYRKSYEQAFGSPGTKGKSLQEFIAGFVEDRLVDEMEFTRSEAS